MKSSSNIFKELMGVNMLIKSEIGKSGDFFITFEAIY